MADRLTQRILSSNRKGYDKAEIDRRTCQACGMLLDDAGEYHSYPMCVLKKAGLNPWPYVREMVISLSGTDPGEKPPLVRNLR